jgi:RNA polymerase sigma-70 factor (ECF subfamily)
MSTEKMQLLFNQSNYLMPMVFNFCEKKPSFTEMSDEEIIENLKENSECFTYLVERYESKIRRYVKRITGKSNEVVEDIVQDVFLKVYINIDKFNNAYNFSSWIYRIAHNQAINVCLYEKKHKVESFKYDETGEIKTVLLDKNDIWREIQQKNINEKINEALSCISKKYQEVIVLNYFYENSYKEISEKIGVPVNTIGTLLTRGKKILKEQMTNDGMTSDVALIQMEKKSLFNKYY